MKTTKNIPASIRQKLLNKAREENRPFNELLQFFAMERFLYRLCQSRFSESFILKGALMLRVWNSPESRPTMDIDLLGRTDNQEKEIALKIKEIISINDFEDGLVFIPESIKSETITEDADYEGVRVRFLANLDTARITLQIDIGFGDVVFPDPEKVSLPTILDSPSPVVLGYSRESLIAEKFEAMVKLGSLNSRMKDFFDIWMLSHQFRFDFRTLSEAIKKTFAQRKTPLILPIEVFSDDFASMRQSLWTAFSKRIKQTDTPKTFKQVLSEVEMFLLPLFKNDASPKQWEPGGPWI